MQVDYSKQIASAFYDHTHKESVPTFLFALREDLKDNKEVLPIRVTAGSAGWDVSCAFEDHKDLIVHPGQYLKIPLGFRCIAPTGWWLELKSRSSSFTKKKLHALYGTIDQDYRGFCYYCAKYDGDSVMTIKMSEKIGQIIPIKLRHMEIVEINNKDFDYYVEQEHNNDIADAKSDIQYLTKQMQQVRDRDKEEYDIQLRSLRNRIYFLENSKVKY